MGKPEQNPHGFRRKAKSPALLSASRETTSDPAVCAQNEVGDLLCDSPAETPCRMQESGGVANGCCSHAELTNGERRLSREEDLDGEEDLAPTGDFDPASSLPANLAGLPRSDITPLGSDGRLNLSTCHVKGDDCLALVIFVHNSSSSDLQQVVLELHSDELQVISKVRCVRLGLILHF